MPQRFCPLVPRQEQVDKERNNELVDDICLFITSSDPDVQSCSDLDMGSESSEDWDSLTRNVVVYEPQLVSIDRT
jgi:hypothetical protein